MKRSLATIRNTVLAGMFVTACGESGNAVGSMGGEAGDASTSTGGTSGSRSSGGRSGSNTRGGSGAIGDGGAGAGTSGTGGAQAGGTGGTATGGTAGTAGSSGGGPNDAGPSPDDVCARLASADGGIGADAGGDTADASLTDVIGIGLDSDGLPRVTQAYIGFAASFRTSLSPSSAPGCTTRTTGTCALTTCVPLAQLDGGPTSPPDNPPYRHAGELHVGTVVSSPDADGKYAPISYFGRQGFNGGDPVMYCALGGDVPAFARYLVAPAQVRVETTGSFPWADNPTFDKAVDHTLAWTAAGPGKVLLLISNTGFAGTTLPRVSVGCSFAPNASPVTIPKEVWQDFPTGDASMTLRTVNSDIVVAGSYRVPISATYLGPSIRLTL